MPLARRIELGLAALLLALLLVDRVLPLPLPDGGAASVVLARDGTPLRQWPGSDGMWRHEVQPEDVSPYYLQALLAYEDRWFHWHPGVNPVALARAAWQWVRAGHVVSGGSTLTMQVARLVDPPPEGQRRSLAAKLRQIARALQLELHLSKREILALYLNHAPMGGIVEGAEMASRAYLGKSSRDLSPAEAALLAALPRQPSRWRPDRFADAAQAARDKVLDRIAAQGTWDAATLRDARMERVVAQTIHAQWLAPLAAERARREARERSRDKSGESSREPGAAGAAARVVTTTIDTEMQYAVERLLQDRVSQLPPKVSMAALVIDNDSLEVLAYAGSADFADAARAAHVDMVRGVRSPGSALKPFLYAMAFDEGLIHSESLLVDAPQSFGGYEPGNFQASFHGPVSVSEALQRSLNVPAVDLLDRLGPGRFAATLRHGGLQLRLPAGGTPNLSLILGGAGTTLEELVGAYRALARGGVAGRARLDPAAPRVEARLMSEGAAFIVRDILEAGGHPDRPFVEGTRRLAWKTGTSFGFRDAWAIGVTDRYTLGVWVGRPDGTPNPGFFGANVAAPLLHDLADALPADGQGLSLALTQAQVRRRPASVSRDSICWPLGLREAATPAGECAVRRSAWLLQDTAPPTLPDRQRSDGLLVQRSADCAAGSAARVRWPVALQPWVRAQGLDEACDDAEAGTRLRIAGLADGARLVPVPGQGVVEVTVQAVGPRRADVDRAAGSTGAAPPVFWLVDGQAVQRSAFGVPVRLRFTHDGRHRLTALDSQGRHDSIELSVHGAAGTTPPVQCGTSSGCSAAW